MAKLRHYGVDGVIHHEGRTAPEHSNARYGMETSLRRATGLRSIVLEADTHDLRLFSMDRVMSKLGEFIEMQKSVPGVAESAHASRSGFEGGITHE